jgi:hypothetical protein
MLVGVVVGIGAAVDRRGEPSRSSFSRGAAVRLIRHRVEIVVALGAAVVVLEAVAILRELAALIDRRRRAGPRPRRARAAPTRATPRRAPAARRGPETTARRDALPAPKNRASSAYRAPTATSTAATLFSLERDRSARRGSARRSPRTSAHRPARIHAETPRRDSRNASPNGSSCPTRVRHGSSSAGEPGASPHANRSSLPRNWIRGRVRVQMPIERVCCTPASRRVSLVTSPSPRKLASSPRREREPLRAPRARSPRDRPTWGGMRVNLPTSARSPIACAGSRSVAEHAPPRVIRAPGPDW